MSLFQKNRRGPEVKFIDLSTNLNPSLAGTGTLSGVLNGCAQGTDAVQYIGREIDMTSLYWMIDVYMQAGTTGAGPIRVVIVYDKEAEGAAPTIAAGAQTDIFATDDIQAVMNLNNRDRFIVLVDEIVECIGTAGPQSAFRKGYRKMSLPVVFNASAAATIAAINTGSIYAVSWLSGNLAVAAPVVTLKTRIRFTDM